MRVERCLQPGYFGISVPTATMFPAEFCTENPAQVQSKFIENYETDEHIISICSATCAKHKTKFDLRLSQQNFVQDVISQALALDNCPNHEWSTNELFATLSNNQEDSDISGETVGKQFYAGAPIFHKKKVVVELSSPNVAKPFHLGHLRSTIVGNFVANIYEAVGHDVVRINFLGDWGTQFGYLAAGLHHRHIENIEELSEDSVDVIRDLYEIYAQANKLGESDKDFAEKAKTLFTKLEKGDVYLRKQWEFIRKITIQELENTYKRLNVRIDHYHGESMYGIDHQGSTIQNLHGKGLLTTLEDGREVVELDNRNDKCTTVQPKRRVVIRKSDGSSLYITRDISAAVHRKDLFGFDEMLYVVDGAQTVHFTNLFAILEKLGHSWAKENLNHVSFGRIQGMSSRKGTAVFLSDILNEGQTQMVDQQRASANTKVDMENEADLCRDVADVLAISAVVCNDLKQRRSKSYKFDWNNVLHSKGDSGIKLQYTHARLTSLLEKMNGLYGCDIENHLASSACFNSLVEPEALNMIYHLAVFDEVVKDAFLQLEPCVLVNYLFRLCNDTSKALKVLGVNNAPDKRTGSERLALFRASRSVLRNGMKLLGLKPLDRI